MHALIDASAYRVMAWKNGGGVTSEIAADDQSPPGWRISLATIEREGPFSEYRGYDRTIVPLDSSLELTIDDASHHVAPLDPFAFRGESAVACRPAATPSRDLNVMTLRDEYVHDVEIVRAHQRFAIDDDEMVFVYACLGAALIDGVPVRAGETLYLDPVERFEVRADEDSAICVVRLTPV